MRDAIIHVGHGKTGTSYIQSVLSNNIPALKAWGIDYPDHNSLSAAREGRITSGNGPQVLQEDFEFKNDTTTLLSGETLFHSLTAEGLLEKLILDKVDSLHVVCYTRDVLEMRISEWGQAVKRGGSTESLSERLMNTSDPHHARLLWWIKNSKNFGFKITIRNYSRRKDNICNDFLGVVLGDDISLNEIALPKNKIVNRSMNVLEYEVLRIVNTYDQKLAQTLSDSLVNELPDLPSSSPKINADTFETLMAQYDPIIRSINNHLPQEDHIEFGVWGKFVTSNVGDQSFTQRQLKIMSNVLAKEAPMKKRPVQSGPPYARHRSSD
jgi:hypothetical protein